MNAQTEAVADLSENNEGQTEAVDTLSQSVGSQTGAVEDLTEKVEVLTDVVTDIRKTMTFSVAMEILDGIRTTRDGASQGQARVMKTLRASCFDFLGSALSDSQFIPPRFVLFSVCGRLILNP